MKKTKKLNKFLGAAALTTAVMVAPMTSALAADDWNIATLNGINSLTEDEVVGVKGQGYTTGQVHRVNVYGWDFTGSDTANYRYYRVNMDGTVENKQNLAFNNFAISGGGLPVYYRDYTLGSGLKTGQYAVVTRVVNSSGKLVSMKKDDQIYIVQNGKLGQAEGIKASSTSVRHQFTFVSQTGTSHQGRTGNVKVTSPSGTVITNQTFTLGSNVTVNGNYSVHKSETLLTNLSGYLNGTYKITYTYTAGGTTYTENLSVVISGGLVSSVTED